VSAKKISKIGAYPFRGIQWSGTNSAIHEYTLGVFKALLASNGVAVIFEQQLRPPYRRLRRDSLAGEPILWSESESDRELIALTAPDADAVALITEQGSAIMTIRIGAHEEGAARRALADIQETLSLPKEPASPSLQMTFWHGGSLGPSRFVREMEYVEWDSISANYPVSTRSQVSSLMAKFKPTQGAGRLIVFQGLPGAGKTWATRALASAWQSWCRVEYMVDPECFFGQAEYMTAVLLSQPPLEVEEKEERPRSRWRLLILEDTGELLSIDAKREHGQAISRLLNTCDGMLGQSLKTMLLITTNEELGRLNPAVVRHGRCAAVVEFDPFSPEEARAWLAERDCQEPVVRSAVPLSDLYAMLRGQARADERRKLGFFD